MEGTKGEASSSSKVQDAACLPCMGGRVGGWVVAIDPPFRTSTSITTKPNHRPPPAHTHTHKHTHAGPHELPLPALTHTHTHTPTHSPLAGPLALNQQFTHTPWPKSVKLCVLLSTIRGTSDVLLGVQFCTQNLQRDRNGKLEFFE